MVKRMYDGSLMARTLKSKRLIDKKNEIYISMGDAAKLTGFSKATISRLEKGSIPDVNTLINISTWLGMPMEYFFKKIKTK